MSPDRIKPVYVVGHTMPDADSVCSAIAYAGHYDLAALLITNPLGKGQERILLKGETWIVEKAFNVAVVNDTCTVPRVMSRKKDFIPAIGQVLSMGRPGG